MLKQILLLSVLYLPLSNAAPAPDSWMLKSCSKVLGYGITLSQLSNGAHGPQTLDFRVETYDPSAREQAGAGFLGKGDWQPTAGEWAPFRVLVETWPGHTFETGHHIFNRSLEYYVDPTSGQLLVAPATYKHIQELDQVYGGYGDKIDGEIQRVVRDVEMNKLVISRQTNFSAVGSLDNKLKGFIRIYDGTDYRKDPHSLDPMSFHAMPEHLHRTIDIVPPKVADSPLGHVPGLVEI